MKYFIGIFLLFYLVFNVLFNFNHNFVYAQNQDVQNITNSAGCGLLYNKCCEEPKSFNIKLPRLNVPFLGAAVGAITSPVELIINTTIGKIVWPLGRLLLNIIGVDSNSTSFQCVEGKPIKSGNVCTCLKETPNSFEQMCLNIKNPNEKAKCISCVGSASCYWSGIGSVYTDLPSFINKNLFGIFLSFAGVLTLLCIIYSAFILQTSSGNPERIKKARQNLTSCISGLLVIIFSIFILRIIGGDIIKIPGIG